MQCCGQQWPDGLTKWDFFCSNLPVCYSPPHSCTHLLLPQYKHSSRSNVVPCCQCVTLAPQLSPLVGLPGSSLLVPAHTDVLPAAPWEVKRQLCHLRMGEQKGSSGENVSIPMFMSVTHLKVRCVIKLWLYSYLTSNFSLTSSGYKSCSNTVFILSQRHSASSKDTELFSEASITIMTSLELYLKPLHSTSPPCSAVKHTLVFHSNTWMRLYSLSSKLALLFDVLSLFVC